MRDFEGIRNLFFTGIGGIGMSALARYCLVGGYNVFGYDRVKTNLTESLEKEGCTIVYEDSVDLIPRESIIKENTLIVNTPAIPDDNKILGFFKAHDFMIFKRSQILGMISELSRTIAVAGTHGKTSISTLTAHLLKQSAVDCTAFLGGISKNYNSNFITGTGEFVVMEADEYDRSFHMLQPETAIITSIDPDHLEIYGNYNNLVEAFNIFTGKIKSGGTLIVNYRIKDKIRVPGNTKIYTYGFDKKADFTIPSFRSEADAYYFLVDSPFGKLEDLISQLPGALNLENTLGAISLALISGVTPQEIMKALIYYKGVVRRFDIRINSERVVLIDDYAHHPAELNFLIDSLREFFKGRKITGIFQPHLYSRTRDYAGQFATSLDRLDQIFLLPVYPARELPIPGVDSNIILEKMKNTKKHLLDREELLAKIESIETDILVTIGAGDIDKLVDPIEEKLRRKTK
ncbi:MAG TPA: UDP-N-acetylmuramate--L-alanine ligase [Bacteroidales bacterium]|nr:UDP-N-acetylmuramate--L-alanine ligase [Bacteroidales bacterium]